VAVRPWHALSADAVLATLGTEPERGLDDAEAERRLVRGGRNIAVSTREIPLWRLALRQFRSLVVLLLLTAAALAFVLGEGVEALAIGAALVLNAAIGFATEWRARVSLARLRALAVPHALVRRSGRVTRIAAEKLVPGDLIVLDAGAQVPADARLVRTAGLRVNEAALTGESEPVDKDASARLEPAVVLADRRTMVYLGTTSVAGSGLATVTATGAATELGRIGRLVGEVGERVTPLERQVEALGRRLIVLALGVCALVGIVGILYGEPLGLMVETAISLAVAAIPEGLPAIVAVALATGVWRLARARALVRRLPAVETLGATTIICADKTGTMTENRMTVARIVLTDDRMVVVTRPGVGAPDGFVEDGRPLGASSDPALARLLTVAALANNASLENRPDGPRFHGDPTETALLVTAAQAGLDLVELARQWPRRHEIPFTP
jgi:Ca2+-transporting ATPase